MDAQRLGHGIDGIVTDAATALLHCQGHVHQARGVVPVLPADVLDTCLQVIVHSYFHQFGDLITLTLHDPATSGLQPGRLPTNQSEIMNGTIRASYFLT